MPSFLILQAVSSLRIVRSVLFELHRRLQPCFGTSQQEVYWAGKLIATAKDRNYLSELDGTVKQALCCMDAHNVMGC